MNENEQRNPNQEQTQNQEQRSEADVYVEELDKLRRETVSRAEYDRVRRENETLARSLANRDYSDGSNQPEEIRPSVEALRKRIASDKGYKNNLEYFTDALALRQAVIDEGGNDPFLPVNHEYHPTKADEERAAFIASEIQAAIDYADGDPGIFNVELQRRCVVNKKGK